MERSRKKLPAKTKNFGLRVVAPYSDFVTVYDAYFTAQILDTHRVHGGITFDPVESGRLM